MIKVTDVVVKGQDENGNGFEHVTLRTADGKLFQLVVADSKLELIELDVDAFNEN